MHSKMLYRELEAYFMDRGLARQPLRSSSSGLDRAYGAVAHAGDWEAR